MNQRTTTPPPGTRIALVEDHVLFAESLDIALTIQGHDVRRIDLPEHTRSVNTLLPAILRANPRIVLLDLDLGTHGNGVRLIEPLARAGIAVVVVTGNADHVLWGECMRNGARRVIPKSTRLNEIIATVRRICNGLPVVKTEEREELLQLWHAHRATTHELRRRLEQLTHREQVVLGELMLGNQVREIAALSVVSEATLRTQVKSILAKLGVSSQLAAVAIAHQAEWQPPRRRRRPQPLRLARAQPVHVQRRDDRGMVGGDSDLLVAHDVRSAGEEEVHHALVLDVLVAGSRSSWRPRSTRPGCGGSSCRHRPAPGRAGRGPAPC